MAGEDKHADDPKPDPELDEREDDDQDEPLGMDDRVSLYPLDPEDVLRAYYKHTAWELLAIGFIAETANNLSQPWRLWHLLVAAYGSIITAYALTKSTNHYNTWQTLRTTTHQPNIQK